MKTTAMNPLIITGNPEKFIEVYESLGFKRDTETEEITAEGIPVVHMENDYGLDLDIIKDNQAKEVTIIRLNVDDLQEACGILQAQGFRESERFPETVETPSSKYKLQVSPSGTIVGLIQLKEKKKETVKDENRKFKRVIKALMYGYTTVGEADYETGEFELYQYDDKLMSGLGLSDLEMSGEEMLKYYFDHGVYEEDREEMKSLFSRESLLEHLEEGKSITKMFRNKRGLYVEIKAVRTGAYSVLFGFTDKNAEVTMLKEHLYIDSLTRVYNRRYYDETLSSQNCYALAMSDVDHFKHFNDTYGHKCGDEVLTSVAAVLQAGVRDTDKVVRYGGDEFLIAFGEISQEELKERMEHMREMAEKIRLDGYPDLRLTMSFGVVCGYGTVSAMLKQADDLLYESKEERNKVIIVPLSETAK